MDIAEDATLDAGPLPASEPADGSSATGLTTLGRFALIERLGEGGMGVVHAAYDPKLDRRVALKLLRPGRDGGLARERLLREARALARLAHPNVVPIHDVGVIDGQVFLVMEYVPGEDLASWVVSGERSWEDIVATYRSAGAGLAAAHAAGMIHRDFKPANVRIGRDGRVRVLDFGLARARDVSVRDAKASDARAEPVAPAPCEVPAERSVTVQSAELSATLPLQPTTGLEATVASTGEMNASSRQGADRLSDSLTEFGAILGTPAYMAPEQYTGAEVGPAADQFSFCVALYEALYGHRPFAGDTLAAVQAEIAAGQVRQPTGERSVPDWVLDVLHRGLRCEPSERYPSMRELLSQFDSDIARDMRVTRRAVVWTLALVCLLGSVAPLLFLPANWTSLGARPVPGSMVLFLACMLSLLAISVMFWRERFFSTAIGRMMTMVGLMALSLMLTQRTLGWLRELPLTDELLAELFTLTGVIMVGTRVAMSGLWWCAAWTMGCALAIAVWPEYTMALGFLAYSGLMLVTIVMWLVYSRDNGALHRVAAPPEGPPPGS